MYTSGLVLFAAYFILTANWFVAAMCGAAFAMLLIRMPAEERNLFERFGDDYHVYRQRTGRFLPRLRQKGN
jgi:protein-S-isoprenylcysteine O-methyltransferase Ste14